MKCFCGGKIGHNERSFGKHLLALHLCVPVRPTLHVCVHRNRSVCNNVKYIISSLVVVLHHIVPNSNQTMFWLWFFVFGFMFHFFFFFTFFFFNYIYFFAFIPLSSFCNYLLSFCAAISASRDVTTHLWVGVGFGISRSRR